MIRLTANAVHGLDEFMLRTGHLKVIANVATEMAGVRHRVERATAKVLTAPREVPHYLLSQLSEYLVLKRLCPVEGRPAHDASRYRYPDLVVKEHGGSSSIESKSGVPVTVWWQDLCLSDPKLPSRVGAVTAVAKSGSKTGLSHVFDWAENIGLLSTSGQSTPFARLLAKLPGNSRSLESLGNPYVLGLEKVLLGFLLITTDLDVFSRFVIRLAGSTFPLRKRTAARLFASTIADLVEEADHADYLGQRQRFHIADLLRDLSKSAKRNDSELGDTSISWHRAASRLETYVDLGFLMKDNHKYEYVYYSTPSLTSLARSLGETSDPQEWINYRLTEVLLGQHTSDAPLEFDDLVPLLPSVLSILDVAGTALPIDAIALGIVQLAAKGGHFVSFAGARTTLEELAKKRSDLARLARGSRGERAEFITIDSRRFSNAQ